MFLQFIPIILLAFDNYQKAFWILFILSFAKGMLLQEALEKLRGS